MNADPLLSFGDPDPMRALAALVEEHASYLFRYAYRLSGSQADAEDLLQQTFLMAHRHGEQLREPERARAWLCVILRNAFLKQVSKPRECALNPEIEIPEPSSDAPLEGGIDSEELQTALQELSDEYRLPLLLYYFEDLSYKDIAEQLGIPIGTVMSRLARGKALLKRRLSPVPLPP